MVTKKWLTRCRFGALVISGFGPLFALDHSHAEPSLANLLNAPSPVDPIVQAADQLASQLAEIERRPFAEGSAVQHALAEAREELSHARAAYSKGAADQVVLEQFALVRAALSAADRLEARAFAAAALVRLQQQADDAEAAARAAEAALKSVVVGVDGDGKVRSSPSPPTSLDLLQCVRRCGAGVDAFVLDSTGSREAGKVPFDPR